MANTRFYYDPCRTKKSLQQSTGPGRYILNVPGNGLDNPYINDVHVRLQKWGANLKTNTVNMESDLFGLTRPLNRDLVDENDYKQYAARTGDVFYNNQQPFVEESRASHPAWMYKDLEQTRWENPFLNPLNGLEKGFNENIQTRILEKDYFKPTIPIINQGADYYLTGESICVGGNCSNGFDPKTLYVNRIH
jgi:hypothetical protein